MVRDLVSMDGSQGESFGIVVGSRALSLPLQREARSGPVPTQNVDAFFVGPGGRVGEGVSGVIYEQMPAFYTFAALTPTPLSLCEQCLSHRERGSVYPLRGKGLFGCGFGNGCRA